MILKLLVNNLGTLDESYQKPYTIWGIKDLYTSFQKGISKCEKKGYYEMLDLLMRYKIFDTNDSSHYNPLEIKHHKLFRSILNIKNENYNYSTLSRIL